MIYLDGIGLSFLVNETKNKIINYRITKIYQYDKSSFSIYFGKNNLLFQVKDNSTIFYLKNDKDLNTDFQSRFLMTLKKHLLNSLLINIRQEGYDRIVYFDFEKLNQFGNIEKYTLIMEIMGKSSNIFLTGIDGKIITALYFAGIDVGNRVIITGSRYTLPFENKKISPLYLDKENFPMSEDDFINKVEGVGRVLARNCKESFEIFINYLNNYEPKIYEIESNNKIQRVLTYNDFEELSEKMNKFFEYKTLTEGLNEYFKKTITSNVINDKKRKLLKYVDSQIKKNEKILKNIKIDLQKNVNYKNLKNIGDILAANMNLIKYGMHRIEVYDFYKNSNILVELNPLLSPKDNLQLYYNKYNKGKRTLKILEERFSLIKNEIEYFEEIKFFIEKENDFIGIEEIENELNLTNNNRTKIKLNRNKKRELLCFEYNNFKIFVGRNNKENEEITFSKGNLKDIWLHIKNIPGSHVLIIKDNKEIDEMTLNYAAQLAGKYSKCKVGDKVVVDYCEKKYVKKIKGDKLANVTYTNYNSIRITIQ